MIIPIWGADYIERWLALSFASLRSAGNLPYLNEHCDFELALVTKAADATLMRADARFNRLMQGLRVKFIAMDEFFPPHGKIDYGVPLTLAYGKGIADLGDEGIGTHVILMNADFILSTGSLKSLTDRIIEGFAIITAPSIRTIDADVRPMLLDRVDKAAGVMTMSSREMMHIVNTHLHNTVRARIINDRSYVDATYYHTIYWRISPDCLAARYYLLMPLCFRVDRKLEKVVCPVDYGFITEICPNGSFTVLNDSDDFLMLELQERDSQAYLLRIAPPAKTMEDRLALLEREIATQSAGWATAEHRRSVTRTLYFHESDLPPDIVQQTAPFDAFMDRMTARMPPPVSHIRHFHWLGAVRNYRHHMVSGGSTDAVSLLDDPRNTVRPTREELATPSVWAGGAIRRLMRYALEEAMLRASPLRRWGRRASGSMPRGGLHRLLAPVAARLYRLEQRTTRTLLLRRPRQELGRVLSAMLSEAPGRVTVAYLAGMEDHAPPPPPSARLLRYPDPYVPLQDGGFRLSFDANDSSDADGTLVVYAPLNFLPHWVRLSDDIGRILRRQKQVVLVLLLPTFEPAKIANYSWLLSLSLGLFASGDFDIRMDPFPAEATRDPARLFVALLSPASWLGLPRRVARSVGMALRHGLSYRTTTADPGPALFSALLVRMSRRS